jgi:FtsH-binding integral membrane protein
MIKNKKWVFIGMWIASVLPIIVFLIPVWIKNPDAQFGYTYLTVLYLVPFIAFCTTLILSALDRIYARLQQCLPPADETQEPKEKE